MKLVGILCLGVSLFACSRDRGRSSEREASPSEEAIVTHGLHKNPNEQDRSGATTLTSASWIANEAAIDRIVASRCAREVTCSNIGRDRHFATGELCVREMRSRMNDELKTSSCPNGIDAARLDMCLDAIRNESCTNAVETIGRVALCRASKLCLNRTGRSPAPLDGVQ
jgi:hypothetical protein